MQKFQQTSSSQNFVNPPQSKNKPEMLEASSIFRAIKVAKHVFLLSLTI
jgi:hypothetical protein